MVLTSFAESLRNEAFLARIEASRTKAPVARTGRRIVAKALVVSELRADLPWKNPNLPLSFQVKTVRLFRPCSTQSVDVMTESGESLPISV